MKQVLEPICEGLDRFEAFEDLVLGLAVVGRSELGLAAEDAWSRAALRRWASARWAEVSQDPREPFPRSVVAALRLPDSPHQNSGRRPAADRARALDLLRQGRSNNEVARLTGRAPNTVRAWRAKYLREVA